jgi:hypothetical protein
VRKDRRRKSRKCQKGRDMHRDNVYDVAAKGDTVPDKPEMSSK